MMNGVLKGSLYPTLLTMPEPVVIRAPEEQDRLAGWDGAGWYFHDEAGDLHGPFATRLDCCDAICYWWDDAFDDGGL